MKTHTVGGKIRDRFSLTPLVMKYGVVVKLENVNYFSGKQRLRSTFVDIPTATEKTIEEFIRSLTFVSQNYIFHLSRLMSSLLIEVWGLGMSRGLLCFNTPMSLSAFPFLFTK